MTAEVSLARVRFLGREAQARWGNGKGTAVACWREVPKKGSGGGPRRAARMPTIRWQSWAARQIPPRTAQALEKTLLGEREDLGAADDEVI